MALVGLMAANLVVGSLAAARFRASDTRVAALPLFSELGISRSTSTFEGYTPLLPDGPRTIFDGFEVVDGQLLLRSDSGVVDARYAVSSSSMYDRYLAEEKYVAYQEIYELLGESHPLVVTFAPVPVNYRSSLEPVNVVRALGYVAEMSTGGIGGPTLEVYDLTTTSE